MYSSVTLLFPGQGSQHVGMGKKLEGTTSFSLFEKANQVLGYPLTKLMFEGPIEELTLTQNTQPAIVAHSLALFQYLKPILEQKNTTIDRVLGHSVGEYAALAAAGVLSFEDAIKAVHLRGKYMQEATPAGVGKMYAMMRVAPEIVTKACQEVSTSDNMVQAANFNEPGQTVISGHAQACQQTVKWIEENGDTPRFRAMELNVSAPFHSQLMMPAKEKLASAFSQFSFAPNQIPYIANVDAKEYGAATSGNTIAQNLLAQVCGSVQWTQSIESLSSNTLCLEVGPGKILGGLVRKINSNIKVISLDTDGAFDQLNEVLS